MVDFIHVLKYVWKAAWSFFYPGDPDAEKWVAEQARKILAGKARGVAAGGARWGLSGAEAILKLRALVSNGDFDAYWRFHLHKEHKRVHQARYCRPEQLKLAA